MIPKVDLVLKQSGTKKNKLLGITQCIPNPCFAAELAYTRSLGEIEIMTGMKKLLIVSTIFLIVFDSHGQETSNTNEIKKVSYLTLNSVPPYLFILELVPLSIRGEITVTKQDFSFKPIDCYPNKFTKDLARIEGFTCYNHLIKDINIPLEEIKKIRRGFKLLIIPNMLVVKTNDNFKYRFHIWGTGKIIKAVRKNKIVPIK